MIASSPKHVGMMQDFKSMADFMRLFVLLQGGCDTPMEQPYRAVDFKDQESSNSARRGIGERPTTILDQCWRTFFMQR